MINRRAFEAFLAGLAGLNIRSRAGEPDDLPRGQVKVDIPPDPAKKTKRDDDPPVGDVNVTPDMKVKLSGRSGNTDLFVGKAKDFSLSLQDLTGKKRKGVSSFALADVGELPKGELRFNSIPLSDPRSGSQIVLEFDEVHCPGLEGKSLSSFYSLIDAMYTPGVIPPGVMLEVDNGPSIWLNKVYLLDIDEVSVTRKGSKWVRVRLVAETAVRTE